MSQPASKFNRIESFIEIPFEGTNNELENKVFPFKACNSIVYSKRKINKEQTQSSKLKGK